MTGAKVHLIFGVLIVAVLTACAEERQAVSEDTLDRALNDRRYLMRQLKCATGEVPCDSVGRRLKSLAPFVLQGNCPKCTATEKRQIQKVLAHVQVNYPKEWNKIIQHFGTG